MAIIGITMGCPVGIGPEIILKHFQDTHSGSEYETVVIGDLGVLQTTAKAFSCALSCTPWQPGDTISQGTIPVYDVTNLDTNSLRWGSPTRQTGLAMAKYIETAVDLAKNNHIDGITTCPISKAALQKAGYSYPGHTEMLADLTQEQRFTMMMTGSKLRVTLVTIHCGFKDILAQLSTASILQRIHITYNSLVTDFGISHPKIAIAGINPHAGEETIFGSEEKDIIQPAVEQARREDIDAQGPYPPDTVFVKAAAGQFDAVVCMYHDQGLIPFKLLHFSDGVNVTIGLSLVRTSVDHGTAYDIAGQWCAEPTSLTAAVKLAGEIAENRKKSVRLNR